MSLGFQIGQTKHGDYSGLELKFKKSYPGVKDSKPTGA